MFLTHLECSECSQSHEATTWQTVCTSCGHPLAARYDLAAAGRALSDRPERRRPNGMWRWRELLPLPAEIEPVSLGEGDTPLLDLPRLASELGIGGSA